MRRPSLAPVRIPKWAWKLNAWYARKPKQRVPKPGPKKLPKWFWPWRAWIRKPHPEPPALPITMYDSVDVSQIPSDAAAVAGYVNGHWPTFSTLVRKFPHAHRLSIAVNVHADADCLDVEKYDATPDEAPYWVKRQLRLGVKRPVVYSSVSEMPKVLVALKEHGIKRDQVRLWTAHYTFKPHRCGPECGFGFNDQADATQYTDKSLGRTLDASICSPDFFS